MREFFEKRDQFIHLNMVELSEKPEQTKKWTCWLKAQLVWKRLKAKTKKKDKKIKEYLKIF